jgi:hypothetical protein
VVFCPTLAALALLPSTATAGRTPTPPVTSLHGGSVSPLRLTGGRRDMRQMVRPLFAALLVALLASLASPARAAEVTRFTFDSTPDAELAAQYSAICGYPLEASVTGRITFVSWTTQSGTRRQLELQSVVLTFTNPATGESLTVRNAFQSNISLNGVPGGTGEVTFLQAGLNFVYVQPGGTDASAGRRDLRFTVALDAEGNVTGITGITLDDRTANLTGLGALVCPALAA